MLHFLKEQQIQPSTDMCNTDISCCIPTKYNQVVALC